MADLVTIATTAALTQFVGPAFKYLGEQAVERAKQIASTAAAQLKAVGREPQPDEPKLLLPLVQAAGLETDETLAARWAALLANAADPAQRVQVQPSFAEVLRQLTPLEASIIDFIAGQVDKTDSSLRTYHILSVQFLESQFQNISQLDKINTALDNLERLGLCRLYGIGAPIEASSLLEVVGTRKQQLDAITRFGKDRIGITHLGLAFLAAVTPPTSISI